LLRDLSHGQRDRRSAKAGDHLHAVDVVPTPRDLGADIGLGLVIGRQDLDGSAEHLAADILDGHLHGLDFTGGKVAIDAREGFHDADLERRRGLRLCDRHGARSHQAESGADRADITNSYWKFHTLNLPIWVHSTMGRTVVTTRSGRQCGWTALPSFV